MTGTALALALGALVLAAGPAAAQQQQQAPQQQADPAQQQAPTQAAPERQQDETQAGPQVPPPAGAEPEQPVQTGQETSPPQAAPERKQPEAAQTPQPEGAQPVPPAETAGPAQRQQEDTAAAQPDEGAQPAPTTGTEPAQAAAPPAPATPDLMPEKEIAGRIAEAYGVEVLSVKRDDLVGGPAYAVKVMNPPGTSNAAFQVTTLMVDATTGELIPQFRHRTAGYQTSGSLHAEPPTPADGTALRRRTHWTGPRLSDPGPR